MERARIAFQLPFSQAKVLSFNFIKDDIQDVARRMRKMNVLWIMADQLRWDYLSCYGAKHIETPNLDWLASKRYSF